MWAAKNELTRTEFRFIVSYIGVPGRSNRHGVSADNGGYRAIEV
jgi:hypothetical protein